MSLARHAALLTLATSACASALADSGLRHDPFARPALATQVAAMRQTGTAGSPDLAPTWNPPLVAVVVAGSDSLVNIDGAVVRMNEEIDGYRLVAVREQEAVFQQGRKRIVLKMRTSTLKRDKERSGP